MFRYSLLVIIFTIVGCNSNQQKTENQLEGTWQLVSSTIIENGDTTVTDCDSQQRMIKIINQSHFAFLNHDLNKGADSTASFMAGGGVYTLNENQYTEYLEYCSAREWEGNTFEFEVFFEGENVLVQQGVEKIPELGVDRYNIERYTRIIN